MKHLLVTAPSFRVSMKNGKMRVSIPEVEFLLTLGDEIRALGPMILGSMANVSCATHGVSTLRAACGKTDSFDAVECAEVNFYGDSRGIVVLVDGVKAIKLIAQKHNLADGTPKAAPALYEHASTIKNAINLLKRRFPGDPDEPSDSLGEIMEVCYISVWDSGRSIEGRCKVNIDTRQVFDIERFDVSDVGILKDERIRFADGSEHHVYAEDDNTMPENAFWREVSGEITDKQKELNFILKFAREENFGYEVCTHQFRSLWTAYCLHHGLEVDTSTYDADIKEVWEAVSEENQDTPDWKGFEGFDLFMCDDLV